MKGPKTALLYTFDAKLIKLLIFPLPKTKVANSSGPYLQLYRNEKTNNHFIKQKQFTIYFDFK